MFVYTFLIPAITVISVPGIGVAVLTILVLVISHSIQEYAIEPRRGWKNEDLNVFVQAFIVGITVLVVAVPEGLPLAVTLALAYSVTVSSIYTSSI